jgi:hypothetical protein
MSITRNSFAPRMNASDFPSVKSAALNRRRRRRQLRSVLLLKS